MNEPSVELQTPSFENDRLKLLHSNTGDIKINLANYVTFKVHRHILEGASEKLKEIFKNTNKVDASRFDYDAIVFWLEHIYARKKEFPKIGDYGSKYFDANIKVFDDLIKLCSISGLKSYEDFLYNYLEECDKKLKKRSAHYDKLLRVEKVMRCIIL
jgi:hypothetical protein